jgi:glycosyltransferase involved in cell wall biosynthesis
MITQRVVSRSVYGAAPLVHRCDLRLPAARREVVTVHDLAPLRFPDEGEIPKGAAESLRRAAAVICPYRFAAAEVAQLFGVEPVVIHNGLNPDVWQPVPDVAEQLAAAHLGGPFVLHSGGATQRKNLAALAAAWGSIATAFPDLSLVMCGPEDPRRTRLFAGLPRVRLLGRVPRRMLLALMDAAEVVVVPSTYEGFGFPALEAMARGTAVVAANAASLPEVCGGAALLIEPTGPGLAQGIERVLGSHPLRDRLDATGPDQARRFSWDDSARRHAEAYRSAY